MNDLEREANSVVHTDTSRRKFVTALLGGSAVVAPVIASLTLGAKKATADINIYIPNLYVASVFDSVTRVSGLATFEIVCNPNGQLTTITYTLSLKNSHAKTSDGVLLLGSIPFASLPWGTPASVNGFNGDTYYTVLEDLAGLTEDGPAVTVVIPVTLQGASGVLRGEVLPAPNAQLIRVLI